MNRFANTTNCKATGWGSGGKLEVRSLQEIAPTRNVEAAAGGTIVRLHHVRLGFIASCSLLMFSFNLAAQLPQRVPNTTLQMPAKPPVVGYTTTDAFPGILFFGPPVCIASPPGETNRLFVVDRDGYINVITNLSNPTKTLFLDISSRVNRSGEGGLLGLAFHPGHLTNRYFYVFYTLNTTTAAGTGLHDQVARFEISPDDPNRALPDSEAPLITQFDQADNHNGGDLHFGPDGYLYVSLGDEGAEFDSLGNGQQIDKNFFSGILRIDVDKKPGSLAPNPHAASSTNYAIPSDNPFIGLTSFNGSSVDPNQIRTEFWAVGLRNPWRMSFDPLTGYLYCGDVGQGRREEVDIITKGGNYGWSYREGRFDLAGTPPAGTTLTEPILDYGHVGTSGDATLEGDSVIGGVVYRGTRMSQLTGSYVFGDFISGNIWALDYDGINATNFRRLTPWSGAVGYSGGPVAFGTDPSNGDILIVEFSFNASIRRLIYSPDVTGTPLPPTLADTGGFSDLPNLTPSPGILPYDVNVPFWSDHARKSRWFSVPDTDLTVGFNPTGNWSFPIGTVWIKHFDLELTNGVPESAQRIETRFLVRNTDGVYGVSYRWGGSVTNADLVPEEGLDEEFMIHDGGTTRTQVWHYPARSECLICHTPVAGYALGFNTPQMNRLFDYSGTTTNQLVALSQAGYFDVDVSDTGTFPALANATNNAYSAEHRSRSYLAANCVQCHQPGGNAQANWDARITIPLSVAGIIDSPLVNNFGDPNNRVIKPGSLANSVVLKRISNLGPGHMPPLATSQLNQDAIDLLSRWITNDLVSLSITLSVIDLNYTENNGPRILDANATLRFPQDETFDGAQLTVEFTTNGVATDRLGLRYVGTGPAEVGVSGSTITFGGVDVGSFLGGTNGSTPLVIVFGANATLEAVQAVLRDVTYENTSSTPSTLPRTVQFMIETFDGMTSVPANMTVNITGVPVNPVISWPVPAQIIYGISLSQVQLNATANVPGSFNYQPSVGQVLDAGRGQLLSAMFTPTDTTDYNTAAVTVLIDVLRAPLTIEADDQSKVYGTPNPPFTASYSGFVNGDSAANLDVPVSLSTTATEFSPVGSYPIVTSGADDANYLISFADGTLTVEPNSQFASIYLDNDRQVHIGFTGLAGRTYQVEFSDDLRVWRTVGNVQADLTGEGTYIAPPLAGSEVSGFYRLTWP